MLLLSSALMVWAVPSTRWARVTVLPHPLQPKASLCSLGQSSSNPRRVKCSPHPLHSRTICPEASTDCSSPAPCQDSPGSCVSFIPLLFLLLFRSGSHRPRYNLHGWATWAPGITPSLRPRGSSHRAHPLHRNHLSSPVARSTWVNHFPFRKSNPAWQV